ncbi:PadR family transcriptional regulator [Cutibacterium avidum]|uniref:PadR family transcriptional regulator n=1 Tax=Cutibacterium avidum TaxID=33010 RepID=UPI00080FB472|nr:PadR family transcriptional regulator [Cutibacterium avidum]MDU7816911.1 PadR family transcriptional regulator [Bacillota bacterium]OCK13081.1 PadR family transcriptional regulator [Cutibacterium avidum]
MAERQLRKGALELVVLGLLASKPSYGGELVDRLEKETDLGVSQGTLYPLLNRLRRGDLVSTEWQESPSGPPRKIYRLTALGRDHLAELVDEWSRIAAAVDRATNATRNISDKEKS